MVVGVCFTVTYGNLDLWPAITCGSVSWGLIHQFSNSPIQLFINNSIMHKKLTLLLLLLAATVGLSAQTIADQFDFPVSGSVAGNGASDNGWGSSWFTASEADTSRIALGGLLNETLLARTTSNRAVLTSTTAQNRYDRYFENAYTDADGDFWFSVHLAIDGNPAGNVGTIVLVDTTDNSERVVVGKRFGNRNVFATGPGSGGAQNTGRQFQGSDARWLVGHMVFNTDNGTWDLDLWVDPDPSMGEPAEADAQIMNKSYPNRPFHAVRMKAEGAPGIDLSVDDLYFGANFAAVLPNDLISVPALSDAAVETFNDYELGDSITQVDGQGSGWDGDWTLVNHQSPVVADGGIEYEIGMIATSGSRASVSTNTRTVRRLGEGFGDFGRTYWVGYWFQTENAGGNVSNFVLADADALGATGQGGRLAQIGSPFNNPNIALVGVGGTGVSSASGHFVVLEIVTNGTADPDDIYIYLDPSADAQPNREDANFAGRRNLAGWNAIALLQEGGLGVTANFDDIRVGNAYADVFADDYVDTSIPLTAIAVEPFTYEPGDLLGKGGPGNGWSGAWDTIQTDVPTGEVVTGGVVNSTLLARTSTNSFTGTSTGSGNRFIRYLENDITPATNDTVWFSFHAAMAGNVGGNVGTLVFADTTQDNYERIVIGKRFGNRNVFATGAGTGATNSGLQFEGTDARWIVGRLAASDTSDNWILDVWVDPTPGMQPAEEDANIADKLYPTANFNAISLKAEGGAGLEFRADDIYLGGVYSDVVPDDFEAVSPAPEGAVETFDYAATDSLAGQMGGSGWDGAWTLATPANAPIAEGGIENFELLKATSSNRASFAAPGRLVRKLDGAYNDQGRTHWVGYWFDSENGGPNVTNLVIANFDDYLLGGAGELLQIGRSFNGTNIRIIGQGTSETPADQGNFIVLELVSNGPDVVDSVYLWVNPDLDGTPDRVDAIRGNVNLANWDAIGLKVAGDPGVIADWDDIYVGDSFDDVVPADLSDLQDPAVPVVATEPFDYPAGEDLNGQNGGSGWLSGWEQVSGTVTVTEGSIDSDRVDGTGNKASLTQTADAVVYERPYFARFASDSPEASTVWLTFLLDVTQNDIGNGGTVSLLDGTTELISVGATPGTSNIAVAYNGQAPTASTSIGANGVNWVVMELNLYGTGVADTARIWVNPLSDVLPNARKLTGSEAGRRKQISKASRSNISSNNCWSWARSYLCQVWRSSCWVNRPPFCSTSSVSSIK